MADEPRIWFVEDYLSGGVIDDKYFSTKEEAVTLRNLLGYGIVKSYQIIDDKSYYEESAGRKIRVFHEGGKFKVDGKQRIGG